LAPPDNGGAFHPAIAFRPASVIFIHTTGFSRPSTAMRATLPVARAETLATQASWIHIKGIRSFIGALGMQLPSQLATCSQNSNGGC
jgi:hypothetical protein